MNPIKAKLLELQDLKLRKTSLKTIPSIDESKIIGVSIPNIRKLAKEVKNEPYVLNFLNDLPHDTLEENILHGILLPIIYTDINELLKSLDTFLPHVDNWAITDTIHPKLFLKHPEIVYEKIKEWLKSPYEYVVRFAIVSLLQFYLDDNFREEELELLVTINKTYYINMAVAWFYSFALIKQYDKAIKYIEKKRLDPWIHNKTIQKCLESYRISNDKKNYLRSLKYAKKD